MRGIQDHWLLKQNISQMLRICVCIANNKENVVFKIFFGLIRVSIKNHSSLNLCLNHFYFVCLFFFFSCEKRQVSKEGEKGGGEDDHHGDVRTDGRARANRGEDLQGSQRDLPVTLPAGKIHHSESNH